MGEDFTAKDFRTWGGTLLAAIELAERNGAGRTIDDFRPRHLRIVDARDMGLDLEEHALLSLLRSWRIRRARETA